MECDNTFHIKDHHPNLITQRADYTGNDGNMGCGAFRIEEYEDNKENAMIFVDFEKGMKLSIEDENMTNMARSRGGCESSSLDSAGKKLVGEQGGWDQRRGRHCTAYHSSQTWR